MTKRARYDGPHDEVAVFDPDNDVYAGPVAVVQKGHLLPDDVRAPVRDELIKGGYWSEVNQADSSAKKADEKPADKRDEVSDPQSTKKGDS